MAEPRRFVCFRSCAPFEVRRIPGITRCSPWANKKKKKHPDNNNIYVPRDWRPRYRRFFDRKHVRRAQISRWRGFTTANCRFRGKFETASETRICVSNDRHITVVTQNSRFIFFFFRAPHHSQRGSAFPLVCRR